MKIAVGSDHAGYSVKQQLVQFLTNEGHSVTDCGTTSEASVDYPDYAAKVSGEVTSGRCERGILLCGTGIGMSIAANKIKGIRAAVVWNAEVAVLAAQHNWANVLCLPSRFVSVEDLKQTANTWLKTPYDMGGRHERRVKEIGKFEQKS